MQGFYFLITTANRCKRMSVRGDVCLSFRSAALRHSLKLDGVSSLSQSCRHVRARAAVCPHWMLTVSLLTLPSRSPPEACCYCRDSLILTQLVLRFLLCSCFSVSLSFCLLPSHQSHGKADCTLFVVCRYRLGVSGVRLFVTSTYL